MCSRFLGALGGKILQDYNKDKWTTNSFASHPFLIDFCKTQDKWIMLIAEVQSDKRNKWKWFIIGFPFLSVSIKGKKNCKSLKLIYGVHFVGYNTI